MNRFAIVAAALAAFSVPVLGFVIAGELHRDTIKSYFEANGPLYHVIDRDTYNRDLRSGMCSADSHVHYFPETNETQYVCEL